MIASVVPHSKAKLMKKIFKRKNYGIKALILQIKFPLL